MTQSENERPLHLLCIGQAWACLSADQLGASLEAATSFSLTIGGCAAVVAMGLSRLGVKTAVVSQIGDEAMGRFVKQTLQEESVDTAFLHTNKGLQTTIVLEGVNHPDHFPPVFYGNTTDTTEVLQEVSSEIVKSARAILITGSLFATSASAKATKRIIEIAKECDTKVVLDIDRIPSLWESKTAERLHSIFKHCDLIIGNEEELCYAAGSDHLYGALEIIRNESLATIVQKCGTRGCIVFGKNLQNVVTAPGLLVRTLTGRGNGDAFVSGFLRGWLCGESVMSCCAWGNACGAIVISRHGGALAMPYWGELLSYLRQPIAANVVDINRQHVALRHGRDSGRPLCILAFDHRAYFQTAITRLHRLPRDVSHFKKLLYRAAQQAMTHDFPVDYGIMVDDEYCQSILKQIDPTTVWCARCIDAPMSFPVTFLRGQEAAHLLRSWPRQHRVKALTFQPSLDESQSYIPQTRALSQLYQACVEWGHQLVVEIAPHHDEEPLVYPVEAIEAYYRAGIFPSWWQLPVTLPVELWSQVNALIRRFDPYCRGVLVMGNSEPLDLVEDHIHQWNQVAPVAGFAVGRSIWGNIAEQWFAHEMEDEQVVTEVAHRYAALIENFVNKNQEIYHRGTEIKS